MEQKNSGETLTKGDLQRLRESLPSNKYEAINKQLEETGRKQYAEGTIRNVLKGAHSNDDIIIAAIDVADQFAKEKEEKIKSFKNGSHEE